MITTPGPTRQAVPPTTYEVVRRHVAEHDRRWARGMTVTDPGHVHAAAVLRRAFQGRDLAPSGDPAEAMVRDLADYDRAFGLDAGGLP